jgi:T3SS (YopN, CesT) and YbjN peptide-binding chaperone 1/T3SS (YopN, CesT) and YbjN peptide-binding chaperone 3
MNEGMITPVARASLASGSPQPEWDEFEHALAATLSVLKDEFLVLSARARRGFVQFCARTDDGVLAETVSNAFLGPGEKLDTEQLAALLALGWSVPTHAPDSANPVPPPKGSPNHFREFPSPYSCVEIAHLAVRTLTEVLRVPGPADLVYKAFDYEGHTVTLPALGIDQAPARPAPAKPPARAKGPTAFQRLRARVLAAARNASGLGSLAYADDGTLLVPVGSRMGWVRPNENPFFVRVHVHLLSGVEATEEVLSQIHELNARLPLVRVIYVGRSVFLGIDLPAVPFRPEHLTQAVSLLAQHADDVVQQLKAPTETPSVEN